jgi:hypothetical protein
MLTRSLEDMTRSLEDVWMSRKAWGTGVTPLSKQPIDQSEEASSQSETSIVTRPDSVSPRAVLGSLLVMGAFGAGVLLCMHSFVHGDEPQSASLGVAELQTTAGPTRTWTQPPPPISTSNSIPTTWTPTSIPPRSPAPARPSNQTATAMPIETPKLTLPAAAAPVVGAQAKSLPHVSIYSFAVPTPPATSPMRGTVVAEPPPEGTAGPNPYDEVPATKPNAGQLRQAPPAPREAADASLDDLFGSRE